MKYNTIKYPLLICMILLGSWTFAQSTLNFEHMKLQDAIDVALQQNKKLKVQSLQTGISKLKAEDIKNEKLPDIEFVSAFHVLDNLRQYENGIMQPSTSYETPRLKYNFTLEASIPIYTGGKLKFEDEKAEVATEIQALKTQKEIREVKMQVITAYLHGLHLKEQQKLIQDKMREDTLVIAQSEKLRKNGLVTNNDVLRTKLLLSNHQMAYSDLDKDLAILEHQIKTLLALPEEVDFHIDTDDLITETNRIFVLEDLIATANENSEVLKILQKDVELKELDKKITKSNVLPKVSAGGEYGYNYPNFMFFPPVEHLYRFGAVGLNLKMPLSNFYKNKVKMKMANEQIKIAQLEVEEKEENIRHDVFAAQRKLEEANKKIVIANQAIEQAKENYRIVRLKYSNQLSLITDLIDADNAYLEAQTQLISLQINKQLKYYQLQYVLGNI